MKKQNVFTVILVGIIIFLVVGITYAWYTWTSENINYQGRSNCFDILYVKGDNIGSDQENATLVASDTYSGGLSTTFKINIKNTCTTINARGVIRLNTLDTTSSVLFEDGVLNYQVLKDGVVMNSKGIITSSGETLIDLGILDKKSSASTSYTIYVWLDNNLIQNKHAFASYYGKINVEANQIGV